MPEAVPVTGCVCGNRRPRRRDRGGITRRRRALRSAGAGACIAWALITSAAAVEEAASAAPSATAEAMAGLRAEADRPRAYGYHVGDVITRRVVIEVPDGLALDPASLPAIQRGNQPIELKQLRWDRPPTGAGRYELQLDYQVFLAPPAPRTLEMPTFALRFHGGARTESLRIEGWPVTVAPLVPVDVSPRDGLGELRPDATPPPLPVAGPQRLLVASAVLALLAGGWLAWTYFGLPWRGRRHRPFGDAWPAVRQLASAPVDVGWPAAVRLVHAALDRHHGRVMFADQLDGFVAAHPAFAPLRDDLRQFFERSRAAFFGAGTAPAAGDLQWLVALARRCRDAERGTG